jgi:hypothetical protein
MIYRLLADLLVAFHTTYVLFVVGGLLAIWVGRSLGWRWIHNRWFRSIHFLMIAFVAFEAVIGMDCPLTNWEDSLRQLGGQKVADVSFVGRLFRGVLFVPLSDEVLSLLHIGFALLVLATFWVAPVRWRVKPKPAEQPSPWRKPKDTAVGVTPSSRRVHGKSGDRQETPVSR